MLSKHMGNFNVMLRSTNYLDSYPHPVLILLASERSL